MDFLNVSYSPREVRERLLEDVTTFQRSKKARSIDLFTPKQKQSVRVKVQSLIDMLKRVNDGDTLGLEEYLDSK